MLNVTHTIAQISSDPIISFDRKGKAIATFTIVTTREYINSSDEKKTEIFDGKVQAFGKLASSVAEKAKISSYVLIKGRLANESSVNKAPVITAEHIEFDLAVSMAKDLAKNIS